MNTRIAIPLAGAMTGLAVLAAVVIAVWALARLDSRGEQGNGLSESFDYDLAKYKKTDPALIKYRQALEIPLLMDSARAVAAGPGDRVYVAGDRGVAVFSADGKSRCEIALEGEPSCLAVAGPAHAFPGRVYVGVGDHVEAYDPDGSRAAAWNGLGKAAILTSIAVAEKDVFVADAGNRVVLRYDPAGKLLGRIGARDKARHITGFIIPSPYFDVAVTPDGLLRVVNPGAHRIEAYTFEGDLEFFWGKPGLAIEGFCGCCNPSNMAILPDGRFVTAEKGIPRVKVYSPDGFFDCVVAGPEILAPTATITEETRAEHKLPVFDVAADSRGRVLVLDPGARKVRVFERKG